MPPPRIFRLGKSNGLADDDMTITSGHSIGGSSVSDRILGRMKQNLTFHGNKSNNKSTSSAESNFTNYVGFESTCVQNVRTKGFGSAEEGKYRRSKSVNSRKISRSTPTDFQTNLGSTSEVTSMSELGKRAPSAPTFRPGRKKAERLGSYARKTNEDQKNKLRQQPIEYSLSQLRNMSTNELRDAMLSAGILSEDISRHLEDSKFIDSSVKEDEEERLKNDLVVMFMNSGRIKLIRADKPRQQTWSSFHNSNNSSSSIVSNEIDDFNNSISSIPYNDEGEASVRSGRSSMSSIREKEKKTKLEKILELQAENAQIKRTNKSLKKTMKKLLEQLSIMTLKEKEATALLATYEVDRGRCGTNLKKESHDNTNDQQAHQSLNVTENSHSYQELRQKLEEEVDAHQRTEFRLKAEIELLSKEVAGLKLEVSESLESMNKVNKTAHDDQEMISNLKHKLRNATSTLTNLRHEAEARDKLIETFTQLLLQKISVEADGNGGFDQYKLENEGGNILQLEHSSEEALS